MPNIHYLKCWGEFFCDMMNEEKSFDYRRDDRDFQVGDCVVLKAYDPVEEEYEGTAVRLAYRIKYILRDMKKIGLPKSYCVLEFEPWSGPLPMPTPAMPKPPVSSPASKKEKGNGGTKDRTKKKPAKEK